MANCSAEEARNRFTSIAMMMPIKPMNRNEPQAERAERRRGNEEYPRDARMRVDEEDRRDGEPHERGEGPEGDLRGAKAHGINARREEEHHDERREDHHPFEGARENE